MRILLVTHETSRTGAPRVAIMMTRGLVAQGHDVRVVARFPGPLLSEFRSVALTEVEPFHRVRRRLRSVKVLRLAAFVLDSAVVSAVILRHRPDLIYVNSAAAAIYLRPARWLRRRVILHVHESADIVQEFLDRARAPKELPKLNIVACSPSVQRDIAIMTTRDLEDVPMIPSVPDDSLVMALSMEMPDVGYQPGELVVGCCGSVEHRKGADLFEELAARVRSAIPGFNVRFVWVGQDDATARPSGRTQAEFIGSRANPYAHMGCFDIFALPSRDDPFPLVVIEAMLLGKPVVAFDVGGVSRQIGEAGVLVPVGDVAALADRVVRLLKDEHSRHILGAMARARALSMYSTGAFMAALGDLIAMVPFAPVEKSEPTRGGNLSAHGESTGWNVRAVSALDDARISEQ